MNTPPSFIDSAFADPASLAAAARLRVVLVGTRDRRRVRCYRLHAGGPCVFTLRDAAVLRERRKRRG